MRVPLFALTIVALFLAAPHADADGTWTGKGKFLVGTPIPTENACADRDFAINNGQSPSQGRFSNCIDLGPGTTGRVYRLVAQSAGAILHDLRACFYTAPGIGQTKPVFESCQQLTYDQDDVLARRLPSASGILTGVVPNNAAMVAISADVGTQVSWQISIFL